MEKKLPHYSKPLESIKEPVVIPSHWDDAIELFDNKEYKKSILATLDYINEDILKKVKRKKEIIKFTYPHGLLEVNIELTNEALSLYLPFLKITEETNVVALLRKVADVNFRRFDLLQIEQEEDKLFIKESIPLALCNPNKLYGIFRELCFRADEFDDEFIDAYGAEFLQKPNKQVLTTEEKTKVLEQIDRILADYEKYTEHFIENQQSEYTWDIIVISLLKLANMPYVNGVLYFDIIEMVELMYNGDYSVTYRVDKGKNYMKKLSNFSYDEWMNHIYHKKLFMSMMWRSTPEIISKRLSAHEETVDRYYKNNNSFANAYFLTGIFLKLIYNFSLDKLHKEEIENLLEETSTLSYEEATPKLLKFYYILYNKQLALYVEQRKKEKRVKIVRYIFWGLIGSIVAVSVIEELLK